MSDSEAIAIKEPIHEMFGLSYANYLVLPRLVLQSMPVEWQERFVKCFDEIGETLDIETNARADGVYHVTMRDKKGDEIQDPLESYERGRRRLPVKGKP